MSGDLTTIIAEPWSDYGLVDCGHGQKLERYGAVTVVRPEPQAMWTPARDDWDPDIASALFDAADRRRRLDAAHFGHL